MMRYRRWFEILIAFDCLLGTFLGGWADETMSSYAWRLSQRPPGSLGYRRGRVTVVFINWLARRRIFGAQEDHCHKAFLSEARRRATPPVERP